MSFRTAVANAIPGRLVRVFAAPYVSGDSLDNGLAMTDRLFNERHVSSTLDVLGEAEKTKEKVTKAVEVYHRALAATRNRPYSTLSIKPGHFGYYVDPDFCFANIEGMAKACQEAGRGLTIDMEDTDLTDWTLATYKALKPKYPILGTVLQARLYRTEKDIDSLDGLNAHIRLCIGIYNVPGTLAYTKKRDMKENLLKLLRKLVERGHYVCVGTHDNEYIAKARAILEEMKVPKDRCEFQMLLGVPRDAVQKQIIEAGYTMRLYVPFAEDWDDAIAYLRRRMVEGPSITALVLKNLVKRS